VFKKTLFSSYNISFDFLSNELVSWNLLIVVDKEVKHTSHLSQIYV